MPRLAQLIKSGMHYFLHNFYRGPIKRVITRLGLQPVLLSTYDKLMSVVISDDIYQATVCGVTVQLLITTSAEYTGAKGFYRDVGEGIPVRDIINNISEDDVFYDIGANVGGFSCAVGQFLSTEKVVAFEPHPASADRLRENLDLNDVDAEILRVAVSDTEGEFEMAVRRDEPGGMGILDKDVPDDSKRPYDRITVPVATIDDLVDNEEIPPPSIVKMDIDGEEWNAIDGMEKTISDTRCRLIYCETHPESIKERGGSVKELERKFSSYGFDTVTELDSLEGSDAFMLKFSKA